MAKPFRFGVQSFNAETGADWAKQAQTAERLGYSAFHLADHLLGPGPALEKTNHPVQNLAAIPAMAFAAAVTERIHIGCRVFCIDYHNPVVLVKSAMTIDMLSSGRLEFGLGAGWLQEEYAAVGLTFDPPKTRIDRLADVIEGVKAFRGEGHANVVNGTIAWRDFDGLPKPVSKPPIMVGRRQPPGAALGGPGGGHRQPQLQQPGRRHRPGWGADLYRGRNPPQARLDQGGGPASASMRLKSRSVPTSRW